MMKYHFLYILLFLCNSSIFCQNIVWNSTCSGYAKCKYISIKNSTQTKSVPDQWAELINYINPLSNTIGSQGEYTSPDYFNENCILNDILYINSSPQAWYTIPPGKHRQDGFTAMLSGNNYEEGVIFHLKEKLIPGEYYRLKFKMSIPSSNYLSDAANDYYDLKKYSHRLKIMLSRYGENWKSGNKAELVENIIEPAVVHANFLNNWIQFDFAFKIPSKIDGISPSELKNIIFLNSKLPETNYSYIYLDDVYLIRVNPCSLSCADSSVFKEITWAGQIPNSNMISNNEISTWKLPVYNATDIKIRIYDRWGGKLYEQDYWDPNGLSINKSSNNYFPLEWGGTDMYGRALISGVYSCILNMKNCYSSKNEQFTISWFPLKNNIFHIPDHLKWQIDTVISCCKPEITINNRLYKKDTIERADKSIIAADKENVIVGSSVSLIYEAGETITLGSNWQVEKGGQFQAFLKYCSVSGGSLIQDIQNSPVISRQAGNSTYFKTSKVFVYPNPVIDYLYINSDVSGIAHFYNLQGVLIYSTYITPGINTINMCDKFNNSLYILNLNNHVFKILKSN